VDAYVSCFSDPLPDALGSNIVEERCDEGTAEDRPDLEDAQLLLTRIVDRQVVAKLLRVCQQVQPFIVQLKYLGTFGGSKRGVLWLDPRCRPALVVNRGTSDGDVDANDPDFPSPSPLIHLQHLLEQEFPHCTNQRLAGGHNCEYRPHMTLSHFVNLDAARAAQAHLENGCDGWSALSGSDLEFLADRIYVLTRGSDDGQFERVAEIPLGVVISDEADGTAVGVHCYEPDPSPFLGMPQQEADWVRERRMALKSRRNGSLRHRRRKHYPRKDGDQASSPGRSGIRYTKGEGRRRRDPPEVIAAKRAGRQAKRAAFAAQTRDSDGVAGND
jgi:hypothetical protein